MKVWIFQTGEPLHLDGDAVRPMRAMNLSNALVAAGHEVILWTSCFFHQEKRHRFNVNTTINYSRSLQIRLLSSPGYSKNISLSRMIDHLYLAFNLNTRLKDENELPDVAFIGYPPIESAAVLSHWLKKRKVPCLLDVKDQWPTIFVESLPSSLQFLGRFLFFPYFYLAKRCMRDVTGFSTMSIGFQTWIRTFSRTQNADYDQVFALTTVEPKISQTELDSALNWWAEMGVIPNSEPILCFVGSLSQGFDFKPIVGAARKSMALEDGVKYVICGDGEMAGAIREMTVGLSNVIMPGWIDRAKAVALFKASKAAFAPYKNVSNFTANIPNKILDYLSFGLPILCPLTGDVEQLLADNKAGFPPYDSADSEDLFRQIIQLRTNDDLVSQMSLNAKNLFDEQFSFDNVYGGLVSHLEKMVKKASE